MDFHCIEPHRAWFVPVPDDDEEQGDDGKLKPVLRMTAKPKVGQNIKFDLLI